ncbi:MAG: hypothetical protein OEY86_20765, partial [Nitrospira sp.]|nr:hypothetical protein [Nitrospira sp.]
IPVEYDGANVLQARYTHGPGIDEPIAVTKGGATYFYHQDGLGSVTDLTDSTGATAKSYSYDAYGNIVEQTGTVEQPYTYTGREFDAESGLYYYRARYYDPTTGRFLQKDPRGFEGGDLLLYGYAKENPVLYSDPDGLKRYILRIGAGGGGGRVLVGSLYEATIRDRETGDRCQYQIRCFGLGLSYGAESNAGSPPIYFDDGKACSSCGDFEGNGYMSDASIIVGAGYTFGGAIKIPNGPLVKRKKGADYGGIRIGVSHTICYFARF